MIHERRLHRKKIDRALGQISIVHPRQLLRSFCSPSYDHMNGIVIPQEFVVDEKKTQSLVEECFKNMLPDLVRRSLVEDCVRDVAGFRLPDDRIRLLVYASMPDSQQLDVDTEVSRVGRILYVRDLLLNPDNQDNPNVSR